MPELPLISIVTPCFNRATMVAEAVESVLAQGYPNFEHIISDGGSTDGTLDVLKRYPHLRVYSERDRNLYDAVNKGIRRARGEVIGFLNTDDYYPTGILSRVAALFAARPELDVAYGGFEVVEDGPPAARRVLDRCLSARELDLDRMRFVWPRGDRIIINSRFFRSRVYERLGGYDIQFRTGADFEFMIRAGAAGLTAAFLPMVCYVYRWHGGSLTFNSKPRPDVGEEELRVLDWAFHCTRLGRTDRRTLGRVYSRVCSNAVYGHALAGRYRAAVRAAVRGCREDPLWPLSAAFQYTTSLFSRLAGGGQTPSRRPG